MSLWYGLLVMALAAGLCEAALAVHARFLRFLPEDPPGARKNQKRPLPMVGSFLGLLVLAAGLWSEQPGRQLLALALALLAGTLDDLKKPQGGVGWIRKAVLLLGASLLVATAPHAGPAPALSGLLLRTAFAFVVVNAVNFLDNTNGILVAVAALPLALAGSELPAFAGFAFLGFAPFNWPRARCIAGDAGAYTLGILLAAEALVAPSVPRALALTLVPLCDFLQVVTMRVVLGFAPWIADRRHLPHIATNLGVPRWAAAPLFALLAAAGLGLLG